MKNIIHNNNSIYEKKSKISFLIELKTNLRKKYNRLKETIYIYIQHIKAL